MGENARSVEKGVAQVCGLVEIKGRSSFLCARNATEGVRGRVVYIKVACD